MCRYRYRSSCPEGSRWKGRLSRSGRRSAVWSGRRQCSCCTRVPCSPCGRCGPDGVALRAAHRTFVHVEADVHGLGRRGDIAGAQLDAGELVAAFWTVEREVLAHLVGAASVRGLQVAVVAGEVLLALFLDGHEPAPEARVLGGVEDARRRALVRIAGEQR